MEIRVAENRDRHVWDDYVWNHPDAVAYHQSAWGQAVKNAYGFGPTYLIAEDAGRVVGVLPLILMKIPFAGKRFVSLPYCDLGGILADNEAVAEKLTSYAIGLANGLNAKKLELRSSRTEEKTSPVNKVRMVLQLPDSSEQLMAGFKAKLRSQVKKPSKDGLTAEMGGLELLDEFYRIVAINMRDLGSPVHSKRWYKEILRAYGENAKIGLVCMADGTAVGAGLILLHKHVVSIPWASTLREYNRYNPNMLLYWLFLSYASDNGYRFFDFGRSTPGEGTYRFKEQWGADPMPLIWLDLLGSFSYASNCKGNNRQFLEKAWKMMPVKLSVFVGSSLRNLIDL